MSADFGRRRLGKEELEARARELARPQERTAPPGDRGCLIVTLAQASFGVPLSDAREILVQPPITPVPGTPAFVVGVINLRGRIVGVLDLGAILGLVETGGGRRCVVVVSHAGLWAALLAARVEEVAWFRSEGLRPAPPDSKGAAFLEGVFTRGGGTVGAIRLGAVLEHPQLAAFRQRIPRRTS